MRSALIIFLLLQVSHLFSQTTISGVLTGNDEKNGHTLVQLLKKSNKDTLLIRSVLTTVNGNYRFERVAPGTYLVYFSSVSYTAFYPGFINVRPNTFMMTLDTVEKKNNAASTLTEVIVTGKKAPLFEQQREKLVFNVENSIINVGNNGFELLQKIPGIYIDQNGNIIFNGVSGVQVKINNRVLNLSASNLSDLLRNLDAGMVKKIEVSSTPGSSNDAAGTGGLINIILKKNIKPGLNGSVGITHRQSGAFNRETASLSVNYLVNRWSLYGNFSLGSRRSFDSILINRSIKSIDTAILQRTYNTYPYSTAGISTGAVYKLDEKSDLSLAVNANFTKGKTLGKNNAVLYKYGTSPGSLSNTTRSSNNYSNTLNFFSANAGYVKRPDTLGSEFSANVDYVIYQQQNNQVSDISESIPGRALSYSRLGRVPGNVVLKSTDVQYFYHYDTSTIFKSGLKYANSTTMNSANYWLVKNNVAIVENDKTSSFRYSENILAGFFEVEKSLKRNTFISGLRIENTDFNGNTLLPKDTLINYNRTDFFPFFYVDQRVFRSQLIYISYARRLERPGFQDMNPFLVYYDPYTYTKGNPKLKPQFTNKFEVAYNIGGLPVLKFNYSSTKNALTSITYQNDTMLTSYKTVDNLADKQVWSCTIMAPLRIRKRHMFINYFTIGKTDYTGFYESKPIHISRNTFTYYNNTTINLRSGLTFEAGGYYNHGLLYGLFKIDDIWAVNFGLQKQLMNKKLSVKLNFSDIFSTQVNRYSFNLQNIDLTAKQYTDSRSGTLSLVYQFGIKSKNIKKNSSSVEAEKSRVKQVDH